MSAGWMQAIDEALVAHHLGVADESDSYQAAKRKLGELIDWHVFVATDPSVNGGWQLVPVEPTDDMMHAGCEATGDCERLGECHLDCHCSPAPNVFRAMLAAAPSPGDDQ